MSRSDYSNIQNRHSIRLKQNLVCELLNKKAAVLSFCEALVIFTVFIAAFCCIGLIVSDSSFAFSSVFIFYWFAKY